MNASAIIFSAVILLSAISGCKAESHDQSDCFGVGDDTLVSAASVRYYQGYLEADTDHASWLRVYAKYKVAKARFESLYAKYEACRK